MIDKVEKATETQLKNIEENTGKSIDQWIKIIEKSKLVKHTDILNYLKKDHGFSHGNANLVALKFKAKSTKSDAAVSDPVADQYKGKEDIKLLYDSVMQQVGKFGKDVQVAPKLSYVSLRRNKQFAILQPSKSRLDIGLNIKDVAPSGILEAAGSFNAMCTHRIKVSKKEDITKEVIKYLQLAYEKA